MLQTPSRRHFPALKNHPCGLWFDSVDMNMYKLDAVKVTGLYTELENMTALSLTTV
jgi:hypothetical protein